MPGAVRASCGRATSLADVMALGAALRTIVATPDRAREYRTGEAGDVVPRIPSPRTPMR